MFQIPLVLAAVVAITAAADYKHTSVVAKGVLHNDAWYPKEYKFNMSAGEWVAEFKYPDDYFCKRNLDKYLPDKLLVEVQSIEDPADIQLDNTLSDVKITRDGWLPELVQALVILRLNCSISTESVIRQEPIANKFSRALRPVQ